MPTDTTPSTQPVTSRFREAYEQTLPEMERVQDADLIHINVDVAAAVTTALGAWPEIEAAREEIAGALSNFDLVMFDRLERYALATGHAHALYTVAKGPSASLAELADEGLRMRDLLWSDAIALAKRGLLDRGRIKELHATKGYRDIAFDLLGLVAVMRESWSTIAGKTAIVPAELDAAEQLADQLISGIGEREQGPVLVAAASLNRQRAFTLFARSYDQARRALHYLRWSAGDLDRIAPSLYANRGARRRAAESVSDLPAAPQPPVATPAASPAAPIAPAPQTSVGLPGSSPFTR